MKSAITITIAIALALNASAGQPGDSSLPITDSENSEATAIVALEKLFAENRKLKIEVEEAKKSAAATTAEAEIFKRQVKELTDRMEALGASTTNPSKLEQRLLQAVHDLQLSDKARKELSAELIRLAKIASEFLKKQDAETKLVVEAELKKVDDVLNKAVLGDMIEEVAKANAPMTDLLNGKVSAMKPELGCIVINLGAKSGVKVGMPFQVLRGSKLIATVRVVDTRQTFAGTVIQNLVTDKDPIQLGDTVKVDAQLN